MREAESRPPWTAPGEAVAFIQLPALPVTPRWARRHAKAVLGAWLVPSDVTETALLLVSELVTNSVAALTRHARQEPAAGLIEQTLRRQPERIVIEVLAACGAPACRGVRRVPGHLRGVGGLRALVGHRVRPSAGAGSSVMGRTKYVVLPPDGGKK